MKQNKANLYKKQTNNYKLKSKRRNIKNVKYRKIKKKLKVICTLLAENLQTQKCKRKTDETDSHINNKGR